jgi:epoxyqueuosine reductase QueG
MEGLTEKLREYLTGRGAVLVGWADVEGLTPAPLDRYHRALAMAFPMTPEIMAELTDGPTEAYSELYQAVNDRINDASRQAAAMIRQAGHDAWAVPASLRSDPANIRGDFPHKTAATRAGFGWIGRHAQLVTHRYGPWIRLGTVLTNAPVPADQCGPPVTRHFCGDCRDCLDACPAGALHGADWRPGLPREDIFDPGACDRYKKAHFYHLHGGHNCGICTSACPFGRKLLRR